MNSEPTWLVVFKAEAVHRLGIEPHDENGDRVYINAVTLHDALGYLMTQYPQLCYDDIIDHMEV